MRLRRPRSATSSARPSTRSSPSRCGSSRDAVRRSSVRVRCARGPRRPHDTGEPMSSRGRRGRCGPVADSWIRAGRHRASRRRLRSTYVAGASAARAAQLRSALVDPGIAAVIATRGGYGSAHLLPFLDWAEVRAARTLLIGYSDITALLDAFAGRAGLVSVHGPMAEGRLARGASAFDPDSFLRIVCEPVPFGKVAAPQVHTLQPGEARGVLRGGTLTQIAALLGTPGRTWPPSRRSCSSTR